MIRPPVRVNTAQFAVRRYRAPRARVTSFGSVASVSRGIALSTPSLGAASPPYLNALLRALKVNKKLPPTLMDRISPLCGT